MLYIAIVTCLVVLILFTVIVRVSKQSITFLEALVVAAILLTFGALITPHPFFYGVLLIPPMVIWTGMRWRARTFVPVATLLLAAYLGWDLLKTWQQIEHYREVHPFVSLEDRLPSPRPRATPVLSETAQANLALATESYDQSYREMVLRDLHEDTTRFFVNSPNFGVKRMLPPFAMLGDDYYKKERCQPTPYEPMPWSVDQVRDLPVPAERLDFDGLVLRPLRAFAPPGSEGYVRSRREVAGFMPHGTRDYLEPAQPPAAFQVLRLDLVSLLLHDPPVVYDTAALPNMLQVHELKTRPLDAFEQVALSALRRGDDLFAREAAPRLRVLGALRSTKACTQCHNGAVGELLGAFSYTLERQAAAKE